MIVKTKAGETRRKTVGDVDKSGGEVYLKGIPRFFAALRFVPPKSEQVYGASKPTPKIGWSFAVILGRSSRTPYIVR